MRLAATREERRYRLLCGNEEAREGGKPGNLLPPSRRRLNNPSVLPLASHRLGGARKTPPRSGNFPTMGNFQARRRSKSPPRRGKAFWSAARFVCRMTLYACRSSSHKTRYAIFVGTLKDKKALSRPFPKKSFASQNLFWEPKTRGSRLVVRWNIGGKTEGVAAFS